MHTTLPGQDGHTASLSRGQRAMWFLWNLNPDGAEYNLPMAWTIRSELDVAALQGAMQDLVQRHPVLRTTYAAPHGELVQLVHPQGPAGFQQVEIGRASCRERVL